mgnify:CR=1 FL=1
MSAHTAASRLTSTFTDLKWQGLKTESQASTQATSHECPNCGAALTPKGRALYDRLLAQAGAGDPALPHEARLATAFAAGAQSPQTVLFWYHVDNPEQTKIVEGQENALPLIYTTKLYEVQNSISMTDHVWDGFWVVGNRRAFASLPNNLRDIVVNEINASAIAQRQDVAKLSDTLRGDLQSKGIAFVDVDRAAFRETLRKSGFYKNWQGKFGDELWNKLQDVVGPL